MEIQLLVSTSSHEINANVEFCLPTINSISTMNRHDVVGVRKEKVILIALNCEVAFWFYVGIYSSRIFATLGPLMFQPPLGLFQAGTSGPR